MHRIIRTALAALGATVVVTGGGLGVAYATTPPSAPAQTTSADADQVAALNQEADDLLTKIAALENQLASTPAASSSPSEPNREELAVTTTQADVTVTSATTSTATTAQDPVPTAASTTARTTDEQDSKNGHETDD